MRAVVARSPGGPEVLEIADRPAPPIGPRDLLVRNFAAALNRADLLQRRGLYPPPPGESDILGLEFAGEVAEAGAEVRGFRKGDRVFGLVGGGAYAELLAVPGELALPIPDTLSFEAAAALPEACFLVEESLFVLAGLEAGGTVIVHAAASGIGMAAIQLARARGVRVIATASSPEKAEACRRLGADEAIHGRDADFAAAARSFTGGTGVDAVLDLVGASYWDRNLQALRDGGALVLVGLLGGSRVEADLGLVLRKRLRLIATRLRSRSREEKAKLAERFRRSVLPLVIEGRVRPVIDRIYPLEEVRAAHERMEANLNVGKIVLRL